MMGGVVAVNAGPQTAITSLFPRSEIGIIGIFGIGIEIGTLVMRVTQGVFVLEESFPFPVNTSTAEGTQENEGNNREEN
ncbi:hypothetical protein SUGI_0877560 [Cryptomeria japonica]|nr:hypothetical protein SUGI_0877560 [Cryptomeria japonica]